MSDETYNGYANRETWAFNLHWSNDQGLYNETLAVAQDVVDGIMQDNADAEVSDTRLGEVVVEYWEEQTDLTYWRDEMSAEMPHILWMMREDVGSFWRIRPSEVGSAVRESLGIESD